MKTGAKRSADIPVRAMEKGHSSPVGGGLGDPPSVWPIILLSDCAVVQTGVAKGRKLAASESIAVPYLRVANVQDGYLDLNEIKTIEIRKSELPRFQLHPGDVLLTEGGDFDKLGRGFVWHGQINPCVHQNHVFSVRVDCQRLSPEFFAYQAQSSYGKAYFLSVAHKTTNLACINTTKLKAFPVVVPPLPEQKKIAHILSTVQRAIEAQERIIQTTTELKKALMHKLFTEGLRHEPQKQTEIGPIPESWEVVRIKATGTVVTGSTPSTKNPDFYGGDYNLISPADLDNGKYVRSAHKTLTKAGFEECRRVPRDSVLVGCIGNVGKLGMAADNCSTTNQQINSIIPNAGFNPHFLYYALQLCRPRLEQAAAKVTLPILNKSNFESFQIAAPERKEQEAIAGYLGILDQKLENAGQKTAQLQDLFRTLLHELMTAKTRVHELDLPTGGRAA